jgi:excinuclease ABC subunit C
MVVFTNGEPDNVQYRQFKIRKEFKGDPEALKQVVSRRLKHSEWLFPQVILVDGGKAQVAAAFSALRKYRLTDQIGLVGLAKKKETIVIPRVKDQKISNWKRLNYSPNSKILQLLQHARDESHRFAQRYYQKLLLRQGLKLP